MKNHLKNLIAIAAICSFTACVPQRKLEEEQAKRKSCETELEALKTSSRECDTKLTESTKQLADNAKQISSLEKDTTVLGVSYRTLVQKYDKLNQINEQLLDKYNRLLEGNLA